MGKVFKFFIGLILFIFLLVIGGIGIAYHYRYDLIKKGVEKMASEILKTQVAVGNMEVKPDEGYFSVRNVNIYNPAGFADRNALTFGEITLAMNQENTDEDVIWIKEFTLKDINILYEYDEEIEKSNIAVLTNTGSGKTQPQSDQNKNITETVNDSDQENEGGRTIRLDEFNFQSVKITVSVDGREFSIPLPDVIVHDVGNGESLPPEEFLAGIIERIPEKTWQEINSAKEALKNAGAEKAAAALDTLADMQNATSIIDTLIDHLHGGKE